MSELVNALIEHGVELALVDPALKAAGTGAAVLAKEWIGEERLSAIRNIMSRANEKLKRRSAKATPPPLSVILPLLDAAQDENRNELRDLWASLLAAAADPNRATLFRRTFIDMAKRLEPLDTVVLPIIAEPHGMSPNRLGFISSKLQLVADQVELSFTNLGELRLISPDPPSPLHPFITALGRQFLLAVQE